MSVSFYQKGKMKIDEKVRRKAENKQTFDLAGKN